MGPVTKHACTVTRIRLYKYYELMPPEEKPSDDGLLSPLSPGAMLKGGLSVVEGAPISAPQITRSLFMQSLGQHDSLRWSWCETWSFTAASRELSGPAAVDRRALPSSPPPPPPPPPLFPAEAGVWARCRGQGPGAPEQLGVVLDAADPQDPGQAPQPG